MIESKPRVLLLGPLPIEGDVIGGTKVSFKEMIEQFQESGRFELDVINISRPLHGKSRLSILLLNLTAMIKTFFEALRKSKHADLVCVNLAPTATNAALLIWLICKLRRKPYIVRLFGGCFHMDYAAFSGLRKFIGRHTYLTAPKVFLETKQIISHFPFVKGVDWLANTRALAKPVRQHPEIPSKLVFIAQLRPEKGFGNAIAAMDLLPPECTLNVYGPVLAKTDMSVFENRPRVTYMGAAEPEEVPGILAQHDLFLFPTYFVGEGYAGVLLESLQSGTPIVATDWQALPEILGDEQGGLLVPPRDVKALAAAIMRLREEPGLYQRLVASAYTRGAFFHHHRWHEELEQKMLALLPQNPKAT